MRRDRRRHRARRDPARRRGRQQRRGARPLRRRRARGRQPRPPRGDGADDRARLRDRRRRAARRRRDRGDRRARASPARCWSASPRPRRSRSALGKPLYGVNHLAAPRRRRPARARPAARAVPGAAGLRRPLLAAPGRRRHRTTCAASGATIDDAAGEAFDKVARLLGLPFPGRPAHRPGGARGRRSPSTSRAGSPRGATWSGTGSTSRSPGSRPPWRAGSRRARRPGSRCRSPTSRRASRRRSATC